MKLGIVQPRRDAEEHRLNIENALTYVAGDSKDLDLLLFPGRPQTLYVQSFHTGEIRHSS